MIAQGTTTQNAMTAIVRGGAQDVAQVLASRARSHPVGVAGEDVFEAHAAALGRSTLFSFASSDSFSMRQCGIELDVFQLETVEGGTPRASATATVPPRSTINCEMVCMTIVLRKP